MSPEDDPDFFLKSLIKNIGGTDPKIGNHLDHCKECKSVLTVALNIALRNMMKDPKLQQAFQYLARHLDPLGA